MLPGRSMPQACARILSGLWKASRVSVLPDGPQRSRLERLEKSPHQCKPSFLKTGTSAIGFMCRYSMLERWCPPFAVTVSGRVLFQARSRTNAPGRVAIGALPVPMSWRATSGSTRGLSHFSVPCAAGASPDLTTWPCTWRDTRLRIASTAHCQSLPELPIKTLPVCVGRRWSVGSALVWAAPEVHWSRLCWH